MNGSILLLDGRAVRAVRMIRLRDAIKGLPYVPQLAIIQAGDRADSSAYIKAKETFAAHIGARTFLERFPTSASAEDIISKIRASNANPSVHGIIVQLPLPEGIDRGQVIAAIDPRKDVDGLTLANQGFLARNDPSAIVPATARGVKELLDHYHIGLKGKKVAVVGRSELVGAPVAHMCAHAGADVIVCHSKTADLAHETHKADVVIVAVGKPGLIGPQHLKQGSIVIDIGINRASDGALVGDVDFEAVRGVVSAITPVPGGVGQMTVLALFENLLDACK